MILRVSIRLLFRWSTLPKTCTSTRWRRCGGVCIVVFGTTTFFVSDSFFFFVVFFTITNTKDPVKKTFCFTGNKKIIYASVKCKKLLPLFIQPNQASLEFTETNRNTQVTFVFLYTTAVRGMKGQSQQTESNCFVPRFRCWWINGETDSHVCLCCSAPPVPLPQTTLTTPSSSSADVVALVICLLMWLLSCLFLSI